MPILSYGDKSLRPTMRGHDALPLKHSLFQNNKLGTFTGFAKKIKAKYLKAEITRKRSKEGRVERKILYVMKPDDRAFLAQNISNYQYQYEEYIKSLKMDGFEVIGYARKSPTEIPEDKLKEILKNMISCLQSHSQVIDVYVSPSSRSCGKGYENN